MSNKIASLHTVQIPGDRLTMIATAIAVNIVVAMPLVEPTENNIATEYLEKIHGRAMAIVREINSQYPLDIEMVFNLLPKLYKVRYELQTNVHLLCSMFKGLTNLQDELRNRTMDIPQVSEYVALVSSDPTVLAFDQLVERIVAESGKV